MNATNEVIKYLEEEYGTVGATAYLIQQFKVEQVSLQFERSTTLVILKELEWCKGDDNIGECPICGAFGEIPEHKSDCRLMAQIARLEAK
jgi:hypothetical protein